MIRVFRVCFAVLFLANLASSQEPFLVDHINVIDVRTGKIARNRSVEIFGGRIAAITDPARQTSAKFST